VHVTSEAQDAGAMQTRASQPPNADLMVRISG
jgi:hypothetical protein